MWKKVIIVNPPEIDCYNNYGKLDQGAGGFKRLNNNKT